MTELTNTLDVSPRPLTMISNQFLAALSVPSCNVYFSDQSCEYMHT